MNENNGIVCMTVNPFTIWKDYQHKTEARNRKSFCQLKHELKSRFNIIDTIMGGDGEFIFGKEYIIYRKGNKKNSISNFITIFVLYSRL